MSDAPFHLDSSIPEPLAGDHERRIPPRHASAPLKAPATPWEAIAIALCHLVDHYCAANRPILPASYCLPHEDLPTSHDPYCRAARRALAAFKPDRVEALLDAAAFGKRLLTEFHACRAAGDLSGIQSSLEVFDRLVRSALSGMEERP